jgi:hypothetical protein
VTGLAGLGVNQRVIPLFDEAVECVLVLIDLLLFPQKKLVAQIFVAFLAERSGMK